MEQRFTSIYCLFLLSLLFLSSCKKDTEVVSEAEAKTMLNVSYGNHEKQKMDIYLPANRSTEHTKVFVYIHGGGFIAGDRKEVEQSQIDYLVDQGWAVINMSYRLVSLIDDTLVKDQVDDVATAIDYVLAHAREWAVNGHRIGVVGHSAGGSLSILYAYSDYNKNGKVKAVGNWAGALDLTFDPADLENISTEQQILISMYLQRLSGFPYNEENIEHLHAISPFHVVNSNVRVPIINIFPEHNNVLDLPRQDRATYDRFTDRLNSLKLPNKFIQIDGADHGFDGITTKKRIADETISYFNTNM